jgi:hypothetical protein
VLVVVLAVLVVPATAAGERCDSEPSQSLRPVTCTL